MRANRSMPPTTVPAGEPGHPRRQRSGRSAEVQPPAGLCREPLRWYRYAAYFFAQSLTRGIVNCLPLYAWTAK